MATARTEILDAIARLKARTGREAFRVAEIVSEVEEATGAFSSTTLRTYVTSVMCANAPVHHANHTDDLIRVSRGMYAMNREQSSQKAPPPLPNQARHRRGEGRPWYWEGNTQAAIVNGLATAGWQIWSVADTASRVAGTDIVAGANGRTLHVEVKGYPSDVYARGEKKGQPKPTVPATQARQWFAGAVLKGAMLRGDHPGDLVAIGLPDFATYLALAARVAATLSATSIGLIWVDESGAVDLQLAAQ